MARIHEATRSTPDDLLKLAREIGLTHDQTTVALMMAIEAETAAHDKFCEMEMVNDEVRKAGFRRMQSAALAIALKNAT